jgi:hypothetical protein
MILALEVPLEIGQLWVVKSIPGNVGYGRSVAKLCSGWGDPESLKTVGERELLSRVLTQQT